MNVFVSVVSKGFTKEIFLAKLYRLESTVIWSARNH